MGCLPLHIENESPLRVIHSKKMEKPLKKVVDYYPFGLKHKGYNNVTTSNGNSTAQKFKYNGIELEENTGLYEMSFRQYDPAIARWTSIDPVTHFSTSTYSAFDNNPIFWADPSGADSESFIMDIFNRSSSGEKWTNDNNGTFSSSNGQSAQCDTCRGNYLNLQTGKVENILDNDASKRRGLAWVGGAKATSGEIADTLKALGLNFSWKQGGWQADTTELWNAYVKAYNSEVLSLTKNLMVDYGIVFVGNIIFPAGRVTRTPKSAFNPGLVNGASKFTTVGRWMSQAEYQVLQNTGRMVEGAGGQTFVTTGGAASFSAAAKGSIYVEFQVATNSLIQGGKSGWFKVIGPNANKAMQTTLQKQGGQMLPQVKNLTKPLRSN